MEVMNCKNCKFWKKDKPIEANFGRCKSPKWNIHPNYYEDSKNPTGEDMVEVTYSPYMGGNFGCVHYKK